uniref:Uncharacterized protein n=1 Tax=Nymphaea colorata TaxID=210225 RepID=A0A5K1CK36_9MAGN
MSMPVVGGQVAEIQQPGYSSHPGNASVGPVIAVLVVIAFLGAVAGVIGWVCSGRRFVGGRRFDVEGWMEQRFASCIDGRMDNSAAGNGGGPVTVTVETPEAKRARGQAPLNSGSRV